MPSELTKMIDQVAKEKGIDKKVIIEALEAALLKAAEKKYSRKKNIEAHYNEELGEVELFEFKDVVEPEDMTNEYREVTVAEAKRFDPEAEAGDVIGLKINMDGFERIAAYTAKQVIIQRIRDAEKNNIYNEYKNRKNEIINGIVRRFDGRDIIVDLGRTEAVLPYKQQVPTENYRAGDRIRCFVLDVKKDSANSQIVLSRIHPDLVTKLFELEVPEIADKTVTIVSVAREPGSRTKIAVKSKDIDVDPVGACVGIKGTRVQAVVQELRGEKIDIVPYDDDPAKFICNALAPAEISKIIIDDEKKAMDVIVADDQLSLAIGKKGQNVRLAVQLTGWKIDIKSESALAKRSSEIKEAISKIPGISEIMVETLSNHGFTSVEDIANCNIEELIEITGGNEEKANKLKMSAQEFLKNSKTNQEEGESQSCLKNETTNN